MAKKNNRAEEKLNFSAAVRSLKETGPGRLYLLWGQEDYLREQYLQTLKKICLPEGEDSFSYKRIDGPGLDLAELQQSIDAMPFMTERSFVEIRDADINKIKEPEKYLKALEEIPDYCTVCFVQNAQYELDGRLKFIKGLKAIASELKFTQQAQSMLIDWIIRRFAAAGKSIELDAAQRLMFISGSYMNSLIPEIEKISAFTAGQRVTVAEVEAVASHLPEAIIFDMTDYISQKKNNTAMSTLAELLADKNNEPIAMLAMLGLQMRKLYAARLAIELQLGTKYVMDACAIKYEYIATKLIGSARGFSRAQLESAVAICAETDYRMKSSSQDDKQLLTEAVLRIAAGDTNA